MNAVDLAKTAYGARSAPVRTARDTEYALFVRVTQKLKTASGAGAAGVGALAEALHENRRLWMVLATGVADRDNALPPALRAQLFYLHEFVVAHSRKVLRGEAAAEVLVDINTAVMRGLSSGGGGR
ncbi:flagellar biosynthesis regulator FlaF [Tropicimonas sp.]|uniref:flagellar biosynthesis regulator FlaF n=1 Tax=Tropicimonas sp. TaxID=2067044 RepID=UPI003A85F716